MKFNDDQWLQASVPVKNGRLLVQCAQMLAPGGPQMHATIRIHGWQIVGQPLCAIIIPRYDKNAATDHRAAGLHWELHLTQR